MVVSRRLLCRSALRLHVFGLDGCKDLRNPRAAFHPPKLFLALQQCRPQPPLEHFAASCAGDIPLAVPDQREHILDGVGQHQSASCAAARASSTCEASATPRRLPGENPPPTHSWSVATLPAAAASAWRRCSSSAPAWW